MTRAASISPSHPLHRMFRGMTEHTFHAELGIADPPLVGYVASLLADFVPSQTIWRLRDGQGRAGPGGHGHARRGRLGRRRRTVAAIVCVTWAISRSSGRASIPKPCDDFSRPTPPIA